MTEEPLFLDEPRYTERQVNGMLDAMKILSLRVQHLERELAEKEEDA